MGSRIAVPFQQAGHLPDGDKAKNPVELRIQLRARNLIRDLDRRYPGLKSRVFGAMQQLPLPCWGPVEHRRVPLPPRRILAHMEQGFFSLRRSKMIW